MSLVMKLAAYVIEKLDPTGRALDDRDYEYFPALATAKVNENDKSYFDDVERMRREI